MRYQDKVRWASNRRACGCSKGSAREYTRYAGETPDGLVMIKFWIGCSTCSRPVAQKYVETNLYREGTLIQTLNPVRRLSR